MGWQGQVCVCGGGGDLETHLLPGSLTPWPAVTLPPRVTTVTGKPAA